MTFFNRATWLLIALISLQAEASPLYKVELIMVAYENTADMDHEMWPTALQGVVSDNGNKAADLRWWQAPAMYQNLYTALWAGFTYAKPPAAQLPGSFTPVKELTLSKEAQRIDQRPDMKVIWHQAWIEPVQEAESGMTHSVDIHVKDKFDIQVNGTFELHRSRYLHISTDLTVQHYQMRQPQALSALSLPESQASSTLSNALPDQELQASAASAPEIVPIRAAEVRLSRRMRSNELHYLDHPLLGIVVRAVPVE